jgi:uncharacterized protein YkwD
MLITDRVMVRLRHGVAAGAIGILAAAAFSAAPAHASTDPTAVTWTATTRAPILTVAPPTTAQQYQMDVVSATNAARKAHGLRALTVTSCLQTLATNWANHLAATRTFTHQSLGPFLTNCHASSAGENIAMGNVTAQDVVNMWLNSPEHRANLLSSSFTHVAIGAAQGGGNWYVVQDFSG